MLKHFNQFVLKKEVKAGNHFAYWSEIWADSKM